MTNEMFKQMMGEILTNEEQKLGVSSPEFMQRHEEIMRECDNQLLRDLMLEQREEMWDLGPVRMRSIKATVEHFKKEDPGTQVNEYMLRRLAKEGKIPVVHTGNKVLVNLDKFIDYLNNDIEEKEEGFMIEIN